MEEIIVTIESENYIESVEEEKYAFKFQDNYPADIAIRKAIEKSLPPKSDLVPTILINAIEKFNGMTVREACEYSGPASACVFHRSFAVRQITPEKLVLSCGCTVLFANFSLQRCSLCTEEHIKLVERAIYMPANTDHYNHLSIYTRGGLNKIGGGRKKRTDMQEKLIGMFIYIGKRHPKKRLDEFSKRTDPCIAYKHFYVIECLLGCSCIEYTISVDTALYSEKGSVDIMHTNKNCTIHGYDTELWTGREENLSMAILKEMRCGERFRELNDKLRQKIFKIAMKGI